MPGTSGDSEGTFDERAQKDSNVIVDGEVRSMESHERSSMEASSQSISENATSDSGGNTNQESTGYTGETISQNEADGKVVELMIESHGGTEDTLAQYKNHQVHVDGGTPGETIKVRLQAAAGYLRGERISVRE
jgi:predicted RNA-binding protein with TRAM domain